MHMYGHAVEESNQMVRARLISGAVARVTDMFAEFVFTPTATLILYVFARKMFWCVLHVPYTVKDYRCFTLEYRKFYGEMTAT